MVVTPPGRVARGCPGVCTAGAAVSVAGGWEPSTPPGPAVRAAGWGNPAASLPASLWDLLPDTGFDRVLTGQKKDHKLPLGRLQV